MPKIQSEKIHISLCNESIIPPETSVNLTKPTRSLTSRKRPASCPSPHPPLKRLHSNIPTYNCVLQVASPSGFTTTTLHAFFFSHLTFQFSCPSHPPSFYHSNLVKSNNSHNSRVVPCGQTDMTKLILAFRNSANAHENKSVNAVQ